MKSLRSRLAHLSGLTVAKGMHLAGRQSTALPGYIAERLDPDILKSLIQTKDFPERIVITGTNGKTTTTHLVTQILKATGRPVLTNGSGSNLSRGVITTLLSKKQHDSTKNQTSLVLEVDEASLYRVCQAVKPTHIVVLNILRDQLDRYGEVDTTQKLILKALKNTSAKLILCADDPWVAVLGDLSAAKKVDYFGIDSLQLKAMPHDRAADLPLSPKTHQPYHYSARFYSHLGHYAAADGSFKRPKPNITIKSWKTIEANKTEFSIKLLGLTHDLVTPLEGGYSLYNIAAAIGLAVSLEIDISQVSQVISQTKAAFGRQESVSQNGLNFQFFLVKNPTGFNQVIQTNLRDITDKRPVVMIINDNFADGRDVSWLWDIAIEDMKVPQPVYLSGSRAYDMALRLEYAGIGCLVVDDSVRAIAEAGRASHSSVRVLPTYTALLDLRKKLDLKLEHSG